MTLLRYKPVPRRYPRNAWLCSGMVLANLLDCWRTFVLNCEYPLFYLIVRIFQAMILSSFINYQKLEYQDYTYPYLANILGIVFALSSGIKRIQTISQSIKTFSQCNSNRRHHRFVQTKGPKLQRGKRV